MTLNRGILIHCCIAACAVTGLAIAQKGHDHSDHAGHDHGSTNHGEPTNPYADVTEYLPHMQNIDVNAAMLKWMQSAQPSKAHEFLKKFEGEWKSTSRMWAMGPDAPPMEVAGSATNTMVLGGRFLQLTSSGDMMGMPMEHIGYLGFSNVRNMFVGSSMSTMDTDIQNLTGSLNKEGTVLTMIGLMNEPMTGEVQKYAKFVWKVVDADTFMMEAWEILYGDPFKVVEVEFTRQ